MKLILFIWVNLKHLIAKINGWIHPLKEELKFVKKKVKSPEYFELVKNGKMKYKPDSLDEQYDSITALTIEGDDCDGFNRIAQVYFHLKKYKAYLVSYIAEPFKMSHSTCILESGDFFLDADYGTIRKSYASMEECVKAIAERYGAKVVCFISQDIDWKVIW